MHFYFAVLYISSPSHNLLFVTLLATFRSLHNYQFSYHGRFLSWMNNDIIQWCRKCGREGHVVMGRGPEVIWPMKGRPEHVKYKVVRVTEREKLKKREVRGNDRQSKEMRLSRRGMKPWAGGTASFLRGGVEAMKNGGDTDSWGTRVLKAKRVSA